MALTVSTDIMKYRESTSDPWKNLIIEPSGTTMFFPSQTVNTASNAEIFRITDGAITTQTVVVECTFASPSSVTSDVTWTSYDGYIAFYGTCTSATTADVTLGNATVPTPETPLSIAKGGTGADNAADARTNLGIDGLQLKFTSVNITLSQQTWTASGAGMYYIASSAAISIPGATRIVAVSLNADWSGLRKTDVIIPYIDGNKVSLMSNVNSFFNSSSYVGVDVLYY